MPLTSFFSALSGLNANSFSINTIGNNLANLNTLGFKGGRAHFKDLLSSTVGFNGAGAAVQLGLGVTLAGIQNLFTQGSIQSTAVPTDVAIQGNGFFVLGLSGAQGTNLVYSRAGNFGIDVQGNLINSQGLLVQGYPVTVSGGTIQQTGSLGPLRIPVGSLMTPRATSSIQLGANLSARMPLSGPGSTFTMDITVYDSLGGDHKVNFVFARTSLSGTFTFDVTVDGGEVVGGTAGTPFSLLSGATAGAAPGRLTFDSSGSLTGVSVSGTAVTPPVLDVRFPPSAVQFTNGSRILSNGLTWNVTRRAGATVGASEYLMTAFDATSQATVKTQNGFASGTLDSIAIAANGVIQGKFSNQQIVPLGQLAMASFANPEGLIKAGDNLFLSSSLGSGEPNIGVPGTSTRGTVVGGALEMSNVDMASEFTQLIIAQRGYQANSRVITTSDEVFQEAIRLIR